MVSFCIQKLAKKYKLDVQKIEDTGLESYHSNNAIKSTKYFVCRRCDDVICMPSPLCHIYLIGIRARCKTSPNEVVENHNHNVSVKANTIYLPSLQL